MTNRQQAKHAAKFTRDLLELLDGNNGDHWTKRMFLSHFNWKGKYAKDNRLCYCVSGGARHLVSRGRSYTIANKVLTAIESRVGFSIPRWNDDPETEWKHVKKVLTQVAKEFDKLSIEKFKEVRVGEGRT